MTYREAIQFCEKRTQTGHAAGWLPQDLEISLPNEVQWKRAYRAGRPRPFEWYELKKWKADPVYINFQLYAWFAKNTIAIKEAYAHQVGEKKPNPWNIHGMYGNVTELCLGGGTGNCLLRGRNWSQQQVHPAPDFSGVTANQNLPGHKTIGLRIVVQKISPSKSIQARPQPQDNSQPSPPAPNQ